MKKYTVLLACAFIGLTAQTFARSQRDHRPRQTRRTAQPRPVRLKRAIQRPPVRPQEGALPSQARTREEQRLREYLGQTAPQAMQRASLSGQSATEAAALYGPALYESAKRYLPALFASQNTQPAQQKIAPAVVSGVIQPAKPIKGINPKRTSTAEQLAQQKAFFEKSFEGHPWQWWFDNHFTFFMSVFPFLFKAQHKEFPPIYYEYFELVGEYPKPLENLEQYMTQAKPWPTVSKTQPSSFWSYLKEIFST